MLYILSSCKIARLPSRSYSTIIVLRYVFNLFKQENDPSQLVVLVGVVKNIFNDFVINGNSF